MAGRKRSSSQDLDEPALKIKRVDHTFFNNMRLKRIVKENHGYEISQLGFFMNANKNTDATDTSNVLGSVGGCELSVYDNEHCGNHLDIMSNFDITPPNPKEEFKHKLHTFCWHYVDGDALIAAAGADAMIHVLSLANSEQVVLLKGHSNTISDLQSHPLNDNYILSTSKDGTIRLWDIIQEKCLVVFEANVTLSISCFHPSGTTFISGSENGDFYEWAIPTAFDSVDNEPLKIPRSNARVLKKMHGNNHIDCIRFANGSLITKSIDNQLHYWNLQSEKLVHSFLNNSKGNKSRFDISLDGRYLCVGSDNGAIYVYDIQGGDLIAELGHKKATRAIKCCAFTRDCRQIVAAGEDAFIMRYDYIDDKTLEEWANWKKKADKE